MCLINNMDLTQINGDYDQLNTDHEPFKVDHVQLETSTSNKIASLKTNPPNSSPQPPSTLTNVPNPSTTLPSTLSTPTPSTSPHPTSLALPLRFEFLLAGSASPGFYINYAIKGDSWHRLMGGASMTTSGGAMLLYYFASMDRYDHDDITNEGGQQRPLSNFKSFIVFINRRDNRSLANCDLWMTTFELSNAI